MYINNEMEPDGIGVAYEKKFDNIIEMNWTIDDNGVV